VSEFDAVAYLASKNLRGKPASGGREVTYPCFFDCSEPPDSSKRKLYIHVADGFYHCKVCGASGGSWMLQKHFGDEPRAGSNDDAFMRRRILDSATQVGVQMLNNNDDVLLYLLNDRGLSPRPSSPASSGSSPAAGPWSAPCPRTSPRTRSAPPAWSPRRARAGKDFFYRHLLIPYLSRGHVIQMRGRAWGDTKGGKYLTGPGEPPRVYNSRLPRRRRRSHHHRRRVRRHDPGSSSPVRPRGTRPRIGVIALPGTNAIPEEFDDLLSDIKRIYIGFDSDDAGKKAAETLKDRIGTRARILTCPTRTGASATGPSTCSRSRPATSSTSTPTPGTPGATSCGCCPAPPASGSTPSPKPAKPSAPTANNTPDSHRLHRPGRRHAPRPAARPGRRRPGQDRHRQDRVPVQPRGTTCAPRRSCSCPWR
jgi:hypothetical protein